jgi:hypothetical protein
MPPTITRVITRDVLDGTTPRLVWRSRDPSPANPQSQIARMFFCIDPVIGVEIYSVQEGQPYGHRTTLPIECVRCVDEVMDVQNWEQEIADANPDAATGDPVLVRVVTRDLVDGTDKRMVWQVDADFPINQGLKIAKIVPCEEPFAGVEVYGMSVHDGRAIGVRTTFRAVDVMCMDEVMPLETWANELREADPDLDDDDDEEDDEPTPPEPPTKPDRPAVPATPEPAALAPAPTADGVS